MSFDPEELREGIVELFDGVADMGGELLLVMSHRDFRSLDAPRLKMKAARIPRVVLTPIRQAAPRSKLVCAACGARAPGHRCPTLGWIV